MNDIKEVDILDAMGNILPIAMKFGNEEKPLYKYMKEIILDGAFSRERQSLKAAMKEMPHTIQSLSKIFEQNFPECTPFYKFVITKYIFDNYGIANNFCKIIAYSYINTAALQKNKENLKVFKYIKFKLVKYESEGSDIYYNLKDKCFEYHYITANDIKEKDITNYKIFEKALHIILLSYGIIKTNDIIPLHIVFTESSICWIK